MTRRCAEAACRRRSEPYYAYCAMHILAVLHRAFGPREERAVTGTGR